MARRKFLEYIYHNIIAQQIGYAFSIPHTIAYSIEAVQEANLACRYNPLFWDCACLSVNAGSTGTSMGESVDEEGDADTEEPQETEDVRKGTSTPNYGKIARAVAEVQQRGVNVSFPNINLAQMDFIPDIDGNRIIYSLKAVTGINAELGNKIIENRPYSSLLEFYDKIEPTNIQMINLIKAGSFDELYPNKHRKYIMEEFLNILALKNVKTKESLTMANLGKLIEYKIIPQELKLCQRVFRYKKWVDEHEQDKINKRVCIVNQASLIFFQDYYKNRLTLGKEYDTIPDGYCVKNSAFTKITNQLLQPLKEWMSSADAVALYNAAEIENYKNGIREKYCLGTISAWEMSSLHFYYHPHELAKINRTAYHIEKFSNLPETPQPIGFKMTKSSVEIPTYAITCLAGTVINTDTNKHIVTILTSENEVVDIKFYANLFIYFNKKISKIDSEGKKSTVENSWFTRGNKILVAGYRRELTFIPKTNWEKGFKRAVCLIQGIKEDGTLLLKTDREE